MAEEMDFLKESIWNENIAQGGRNQKKYWWKKSQQKTQYGSHRENCKLVTQSSQ